MKNHNTISNANSNNRYIENKGTGIDTIVDDHIGLIDPTININEYAPFSSILTIHNLTLNHNGNYTCQINNQGGLVEYTAVLSVSGSLITKINLFFHGLKNKPHRFHKFYAIHINNL